VRNGGVERKVLVHRESQERQFDRNGGHRHRHARAYKFHRPFPSAAVGCATASAIQESNSELLNISIAIIGDYIQKVSDKEPECNCGGGFITGKSAGNQRRGVDH
jgi:hypothetical protein